MARETKQNLDIQAKPRSRDLDNRVISTITSRTTSISRKSKPSIARSACSPRSWTSRAWSTTNHTSRHFIITEQRRRNTGTIEPRRTRRNTTRRIQTVTRLTNRTIRSRSTIETAHTTRQTVWTWCIGTIRTRYKTLTAIKIVRSWTTCTVWTIGTAWAFNRTTNTLSQHCIFVSSNRTIDHTNSVTQWSSRVLITKSTSWRGSTLKTKR